MSNSRNLLFDKTTTVDYNIIKWLRPLRILHILQQYYVDLPCSANHCIVAQECAIYPLIFSFFVPIVPNDTRCQKGYAGDMPASESLVNKLFTQKPWVGGVEITSLGCAPKIYLTLFTPETDQLRSSH